MRVFATAQEIADAWIEGESDVIGVNPRHLRRVEHGENVASKAVLTALADVHGLPLEDYLKQVAKYVKR